MTSLVSQEPASALAPLCVPDTEVARLILGRDLNQSTRNRLRARDEWPTVTFIAGFAVVTVEDLEPFLHRAKGATDAARAERQARGRRNIAKRWERVHGTPAE